jgi:hypothetical protein
MYGGRDVSGLPCSTQIVSVEKLRRRRKTIKRTGAV